VFDLPVTVPGERMDWFNTDFFSGAHGIERAGVRVDRTFRPVETKIDNLFACGSILAECEIMSLQCGHGLAIATGVAAAKSCAQELS
jgi:anaerobic glycerol-3-phosphate dehydrogenase